nr:NADPH:quinone oxidoreductase family protein [Sneathiella limimaris]
MVEVKAASLNFPDLLMTYGKYQFKPELPFVIGMEGAGEVIGVGAGVGGYRVGDAVLFRGKTGAVSQFKLCSTSDISCLPRTLSFETGAAFGVTFQTAYVALAKRGGLRAGETLVVFGAGGGVGQASVAVGKALGATVIACASDEDKLEIAKNSGADFLINYKTENLVQKILELTGGDGVDIVLDPVGGQLLEEAVHCLSWQGRLLIVGFAGGSFGKPDLATIQNKGLALIGVRAGEYGRRNPFAGQKAMEELLKLTEKHELQPYVGKVWAFKDTPRALRDMEARKVVGKQVVTISSC